MDDIDRSIIQIIQENSSLTHTEIAKKVNRSQPTIGMRIRKLEKAGILKFQAGINLKTADIILARAEIQTNNPKEIERIVKHCPFMINAFRLSGNSNISVLIVGFKLSEIDNIINCHFRKNHYVESISLDVILDVINDFVLPFNINIDYCEICKKGQCFSNLKE